MALTRTIDGKDYVYLYYVDWNTTLPDSIHLARTPVEAVVNPEAWEKYSSNGFVAAKEAKSTPVISPSEGDVYTSVPSISYNDYLGKYLAVFETNVGFKWSPSKDSLKWDKPQLLVQFPNPQFPIIKGNTWFSYPSYLSFDKSRDQETGQNGVLIYSRGIRSGKSHQMVYRPMILQK